MLTRGTVWTSSAVLTDLGVKGLQETTTVCPTRQHSLMLPCCFVSHLHLARVIVSMTHYAGGGGVLALLTKPKTHAQMRVQNPTDKMYDQVEG